MEDAQKKSSWSSNADVETETDGCFTFDKTRCDHFKKATTTPSSEKYATATTSCDCFFSANGRIRILHICGIKMPIYLPGVCINISEYLLSYQSPFTDVFYISKKAEI